MNDEGRKESKELKFYKFLSKRVVLSEKELKYLENLEIGFQGESSFDCWIDKLKSDVIVLKDLLLEHNNTYFQIDSLLITCTKTYIFEVKNYKGDFYIENDKWKTRSGIEIKNPLLQLKRTESLLRQVLQPLSNNQPIESYLVFMDHNFFLYNTTLDLPIIFNHQLNSFFNDLTLRKASLKSTHKQLASYITSKHLDGSPFFQLPEIDFESLTKGIICPNCSQVMALKSRSKLSCLECRFVEHVDSGVQRNVEEFRVLFPTLKVTTDFISRWCTVVPPRAIRRILLKNFKKVGASSDVYFIDENS